MDLIGKLMSMFGQRKAAAKKVLAGLAMRHVKGESISAKDIETLEAAMTDAGVSPQEFQKNLHTFLRRMTLETVAAGLPAAEQAYLAAHAAQVEHTEETHRILARRHEENLALGHAVAEASYPVERCRDAMRELDILSETHRELFALDAPNLDEFTLHCGSLISIHDPAAPIRFVTTAIFERETDRRTRLKRKAQAEATAAYINALSAWELGEEDSFGNRKRSRGPRPTEKAITWATMPKGKTPTDAELETCGHRKAAATATSQPETPAETRPALFSVGGNE